MAQEAKNILFAENLKLVHRPEKNFQALDRARPDSSSGDFQYFLDTSDGTTWIGKSSIEALFLPPYPPQRYRKEYKEWLGLAIYKLLRIHTPDIALSMQYPQPSAHPSDVLDYKNPCLHLMSRLDERFRPFGSLFLAYYREATQNGRQPTVRGEEGEDLLIKGFGEALAVGCFIHDIDCLGHGGANMGYTIETDAEGKKYAQLFKIDAGEAFSFLGDFDQAKHDPRQRNVPYAPGGRDTNGYYTLSRDPSLEEIEEAKYFNHIYFIQSAEKLHICFFDRQGKYQQTALSEAEKLSFLKALEKEEKAKQHFNGEKSGKEGDLRGALVRITYPSNIQMSFDLAISAGSRNPPREGLPTSLHSLLHYGELSTQDQAEFAKAARRILQVPEAVFKSYIDQVVVKEGFTQKEADRILHALIARKAAFINGFTHEVSKQLRAEVQAARQALLAKVFAPALPDAAIADEGCKNEETALFAAYENSESQWVEGEGELAKQHICGAAAEDRKLCQVFQLPAVSAHFTGRAEALASIAHTLDARHGSVIIQSISGLGGIGKTQLVARYAQLAGEGAICGRKRLQYQAVVWFNAERGLDIQCIALAEAWCGWDKPTTEEAIAAVHRYLRNKRTLLIFDNALDIESIASYLPPDPKQRSLADRFTAALFSRDCHILITSRNADWGQITSLKLDGFTPEEATAFVRSRLPDTSQADIQTLVDTVSNLPIALSHAVAYIAEGHCSLQTYPQKFVLHQLSLGYSITAQGAADNTVFTTFLLTFARLKQIHPVIVPILRACAYLAPADIPVTWLEVGLAGSGEGKAAYMLGRFTPLEVQQGLIALQGHGLLQSTKLGLLAIHRLVQQVVRHQLAPIEQRAQISQMQQYLGMLNPQEGGDAIAEERWRAFMPHLESIIGHHDDNACVDDVHIALVLRQLSDIYFYVSGQGQATRKMYILSERALKIQEMHYGTHHPEVGLTLMNLGCIKLGLMEIHESCSLLERALSIIEVCYGPNHYQMGRVLVNLSGAYNCLRDADKAYDFSKRALKIMEACYGPKHSRVALALLNLGETYGIFGEVPKQRDLLEQALLIQEACYGPDHYLVALILQNLGNVYGKLGNTAKQQSLLERALAIKEMRYGWDHYEVVSVLISLGDLHGALGDVSKQQGLLERALAIQMHYGRNQYQVAAILVCLGTVYGNLKDMGKARHLLERALAIYEGEYEDYFQIVIALANLAEAYGKLRDFAKTREILERALTIYEGHRGQDYFRIAITLMALGHTYARLGDLVKARDILTRTLEIQETHCGQHHYPIATTLYFIGGCYGDSGDMDKARHFFERALALIERKYGQDCFLAARILIGLGMVYGKLGSVDKQREILERALLVQGTHYGQDHYQITDILVQLGDAYGDLRNFDKQREILERALTIQEVRYGPNHLEVAITLVNLGNAYAALGNVAKKRDLLIRALAIQEGRDYYQMGTTLTNLAVAYRMLQKPNAALQTAQRAYQVLMSHSPAGEREEAKIKQCLKILRSQFTLEVLQATSPISAEDKVDNGIQLATMLAGGVGIVAATAAASLFTDHNQSTAGRVIAIMGAATVAGFFAQNSQSVRLSQPLLLSPHDVATQDVQTVEQRLSQTVLALLAAIEGQRQADWDPQAHIHFTETVIDALSENENGSAFASLCENPEYKAVPALLGGFIQYYVASHPELHELSSYPQIVHNLKSQLFTGGLLRQEQSTAEEKQSEKETLLQAEEKETVEPTTPVGTSFAQLASQYGLANQSIQQAQQGVGQAVLALLTAIETQRQPGWDLQAHISFTATVVSAFSKDVHGKAFAYLCAHPERNSIPVPLGQFIQDYVAQHPTLRELSTYPDFARTLKNQLLTGNLDALYARFDVPKPEHSLAVSEKKTCLMM
jgi:tetratricopeptide (TPR) repeat protein